MKSVDIKIHVDAWKTQRETQQEICLGLIVKVIDKLIGDRTTGLLSVVITEPVDDVTSQIQ